MQVYSLGMNEWHEIRISLRIAHNINTRFVVLIVTFRKLLTPLFNEREYVIQTDNSETLQKEIWYEEHQIEAVSVAL